MKVLLIGGSRFVGKHLIEMLRTHCDLTVFNRGTIQTQYPKNVKYIQGDRNSPFQLKEKFDVVIDMVAYTGDQAKAALEQLNFDFFLHCGTVCSYRKSEIFPISEEAPLGLWPLFGDYNKGKVDCEHVLARSGVPHAIIRPVYILGPDNFLDRENFIYSRIIKGETLTIPGNGEAIAQFVSAEDTAKAIALIVEKKISGAFNCTGDELITLNGLVREMGKIVGKEPIVRHSGAAWDIKHFPFPNEHFIFSNEKIKKLGIHFSPLLKLLQESVIGRKAAEP